MEVAAVMRDVACPWWIAGGWAIDLFVGRVTREHADVEVGVFMPDQGAIRSLLADRELRRVRNDAWEPWLAGDPIELPEFQIQARSTTGAGPDVFDVFLNPLEGDDWVSRRHDGLRVRADQIVLRSDSGIPFLRPEIQLLYKAKHHRPKDEADFQAALPLLGRPARRWLVDALAQYHPGDPWIARL